MSSDVERLFLFLSVTHLSSAVVCSLSFFQNTFYKLRYDDDWFFKMQGEFIFKYRTNGSHVKVRTYMVSYFCLIGFII